MTKSAAAARPGQNVSFNLAKKKIVPHGLKTKFSNCSSFEAGKKSSLGDPDSAEEGGNAVFPRIVIISLSGVIFPFNYPPLRAKSEPSI